MAPSHGTSGGCHTTTHVSRHLRSQDMLWDQATPGGTDGEVYCWYASNVYFWQQRTEERVMTVSWDNLTCESQSRCVTFPMSVFPSASLIKTSLLSPSSNGQYEPSGCTLLMPGSCRLRHSCHRHTPENMKHTIQNQIQTPVYQDHDVTLVMRMQVFDHIRQCGKLCCVISEVHKLVHVVDVIPLDILWTNQHTNYYFTE